MRDLRFAGRFGLRRMARGRIELPTRGFSVRCSTNCATWPGYAAEELSGLHDGVGVAACHGLGEFLALRRIMTRHRLFALPLFVVLLGAAVLAARGTGPQGEQYDLVLMGGRVLDPETGLDAKRNVGIRDGRIAAVTVEPLAGRETPAVAGLVVAPGVIDLHAHGQDSEGYRYHAHDGVTTALELEIGT